MASWLGRVAGDIALLYGARGGLYMGGGLIANIIPALQTGHFREAFESRGDRSAYVAKLPVKVIKTAADAGLRGAAYGLCVAYCEASDCDDFPGSQACDRIHFNYTKLTGEESFPCDEVAPPPPPPLN